METLRHAIFDLDGTLIDSLPGIAWSVEQALAACGLPELSRDLRPLIGPPIRSILATVSGLQDAPALDGLEQAFRTSYDADGWNKTICYEGVPDMLWGLLTRDIGLWVVTNKPSKVSRRILRHLKIDGFFQEITCLDSRTPAYVSKAEALRDLLDRHSLSFTECLLIGDTAEDCQAAVATEVACAIVPHGYGPSLPPSIPFSCFRVTGWDGITGLFERAPASAPLIAGGTAR
jgi:phosphoglycolate phosphatase